MAQIGTNIAVKRTMKIRAISVGEKPSRMRSLTLSPDCKTSNLKLLEKVARESRERIDPMAVSTRVKRLAPCRTQSCWGTSRLVSYPIFSTALKNS